MMTHKWLGLAFVAATSLAASRADATVVVADESVMLLPATPGIAMGVGAMVTSIGTAIDLDSVEPSTGWAASAIVFGSLSLISGGIYAGLAAEHDKPAPQHVFIPTSVANVAFGVTSLALGIASATSGEEMAAPPVTPMVTFDAEGRPFVAFQGTF